MKNCPDRVILSAFFDGELTSDEHSKIQDHIDSCPVCSQELSDLEELQELLLEIPVDDRAMRRVENRIMSEPQMAKGLRLPKSIAAALLCALAVSLMANVYFVKRFSDADERGMEAGAKTGVSISLLQEADGTRTIQVQSDRRLRLLKEPSIHVIDRPPVNRTVDATGEPR